MTGIIDFLGKTINVMYGAMGNMLLAFIAYIALVFIISFKMIQNTNDNIILGSYIRPIIEKAEKKAKTETERNTIRLKLSSEYGYTMFGSMYLLVSKILFGILFALGFLSQNVTESKVFDIDMGISPKTYLLSHDTTYVRIAIILLIAAVLKITRENIAQKSLLINETLTNAISTVIMIVLAAFLPSAFALYWLLFEIVELLIMTIETIILKEKRLQALIKKYKI